MALSQTCTIDDIYALPEGQRAELIDGQLYMMAPPKTIHQRLVSKLGQKIANYIDRKDGDCEVFPAPFAVFMSADEKTYVEPDISVICDRDKLDRHGCKGAPDLIVEILSPSTQRRDRLIKLELYQRAGVREYWLVSPEEQTVQVLLFTNGLLLPRELYKKGDVAKVNVLEGCFLELEKVFPGP